MKIIALGDIHGRDTWKKIVEKEKYDTIVFIGDYFDSRENISAVEQIANFKDIINLQLTSPNLVKLLIGNHDYHYMRGVKEHYSGYQAVHSFDIQEVLHQALALGNLEICTGWEDLLFSHAGITKTWLGALSSNPRLIVSTINRIFRTDIRQFKFTPGMNYNPYGDEPCQSPLWVRPRSLRSDLIEGVTQIVGHTTQDKLRIDKDVVLIDTLGTSGEYLIWEDGKFSIGKI